MIITNINEVIDLILNQEPIALFQKDSEWGPRALGHRSILFDPRNKNAQHIVNSIKKREWWRPFAGTILLDHVNDWFEMHTLKESPYMSFAIDAKDVAKEKISSIIHDGTCRIQTVTREQNKIFYDLIKLFYDRTGVPILLNTSLNLAGEPLAETLDDAKSIVERSELNYIYYVED